MEYFYYLIYIEQQKLIYGPTDKGVLNYFFLYSLNIRCQWPCGWKNLGTKNILLKRKRKFACLKCSFQKYLIEHKKHEFECFILWLHMNDFIRTLVLINHFLNIIFALENMVTKNIQVWVGRRWMCKKFSEKNKNFIVWYDGCFFFWTLVNKHLKLELSMLDFVNWYR